MLTLSSRRFADLPSALYLALTSRASWVVHGCCSGEEDPVRRPAGARLRPDRVRRDAGHRPRRVLLRRAAGAPRSCHSFVPVQVSYTRLVVQIKKKNDQTVLKYGACSPVIA